MNIMFPVPNTDFGGENVCIMNVWESDEILSFIQCVFRQSFLNTS